MAEMMIEMGEARTSSQKPNQTFMSRRAWRMLSARLRGPGRSLGQRDGAAIRELQMIFVQASFKREAWNLRGIVQAIQFLFFDAEEHVAFIQKRYR